MIAINKALKIILATGFLTFFLIGSFSVYTMDMSMGSGYTPMVNCPLSSGTALCTMTPFEHITAAQNLFTALPHEASPLSLALLLIAGLALFTVFYSELFSSSNLLYICRSIFEHRYIPHGVLQEAFSNGILNPKLY